jgi:hypothetical protein
MGRGYATLFSSFHTDSYARGYMPERLFGRKLGRWEHLRWAMAVVSATAVVLAVTVVSAAGGCSGQGGRSGYDGRFGCERSPARK